MASSGVTTENEVKENFDLLKTKKKYRYVIFKFTDDKKKVINDKVKERDPSNSKEALSRVYAEFKEDLPPNEGRYAVFDMDFEKEDKDLGSTATSRNLTTLLFVVWCPDTAPVREKMLIASTKDAVKKALCGVQLEIQATDMSELDENDVVEKCRSKKR